MRLEYLDIVLTKSAAADLKYIQSLESESENARFIHPWSTEEHLSAQSDADYFHALILNHGERVGFVILAGLQNPNRSIELMRIVVGKKGVGLGRQTLRAVKALCFGRLRAHRLWLDVKTLNFRAKNLYLSEGFIEEGTLRDCIKTNDGYESLTILSLLESEYAGMKP